MKNLKVHQPLVCPAVPSRLSRINRSFPILALIAVFAGCLLSGNVAHAQVNQLRFDFEDAPGTTTASDTSLGGVVVTLGMQTNGGALFDGHGALGSGVLGAGRALNFSRVVDGADGGIAGPVACITNASLGFGSVSSFTVTMWIKLSTNEVHVVGNTGARLFVMGDQATLNDFGSAGQNIAMKVQANNLLQLGINALPIANTFSGQATFAQNLPTNKWLFIAATYDGTSVKIYQGSDTANANLVGSNSAPGLTVDFGANGALFLGNRKGLGRCFDGFIDDFRFYTGTAGSASFVEGVRASLAPLPVISGVYPDGIMLQQATNKLIFNALSTTNITNVSVVLNNINVSSQLLYVTNGTAGTSTNLDVSYTNLAQNVAYSVVIAVTDASGAVNIYSKSFDTFNPTNLIVEAEEFDHDSGLFIDNADYTSYATNTSYFGLDSVEAIDTHKGSGAGSSATDYRAGAADPTRTQTPPNGGDLPRQRFLDLATNDAAVVDHYVGYWSSAEWQNYTRTFPAGKYNVYGRLAAGAGSAIVAVAHVTSGQGTPGQTTTNLGTFSLAGTSYTTFQWIPLRDGVGNLATVELGGVNTVRVTSGGGANGNFYMLVPANTNLPAISGVYPNGAALFQATNKLVFTVSSPVSTIGTNSITLSLNGTNVSSGLVFSGGPSSWNVSYTGLQLSQSYSVVIGVTDANGNTSGSTLNIDTWNPVLQIEAEDFDFNGGQYIDNPVPTTGPAANSYYGQVGTEGIDEHTAAPHTGGSLNNYRPSDLTATTLVTDAARQQFISAGAPDYNLGFLGNFFWQNYTRTFPAGTYNVYARIARGDAGAASINWDEITGGWGTAAQFTKRIGTFTLPGGGGWSAYKYFPLMDQFTNYADVVLGGTNTFRATVTLPININFYMLVPARTDLPRIDNVYPNSLVPMQSTNMLAFVASSPNGINTTNIHVTLNGVDISSNLVFTGSSTSWNVSYPGLLPGVNYAVVITFTDASSHVKTFTVNFSTAFNPADFTWEAEDFDFDPGSSPAPNGSGLRYIDNPVPTSIAATNSYFSQVGVSDIDYGAIFSAAMPVGSTYLYRASDYVATEVTSDQQRQKYAAAQLLNSDPTIADYDVFFWATNGWINYTRTFPTGQFYLYARLSAASAFNLQCAQVTGGWGTATQTSQYLGTFRGTNTSFAIWQWVPLVNTNTSLPVVLSLGGTNTFQMTGDYKENGNFFQLVPLPQPVSLTASLSGTNIMLSFPTQVGSTYTVYWKNNLLDPTWTQLGAPVSGNGSIMSVLDDRSQSHRFYRLTIQ